MKADPPKPPVVWNGKSYDICLPWPAVAKPPWVEVQVTPQVTYVVRVREAGTDKWLVGVETPVDIVHLCRVETEHRVRDGSTREE